MRREGTEPLGRPYRWSQNASRRSSTNASPSTRASPKPLRSQGKGPSPAPDSKWSLSRARSTLRAAARGRQDGGSGRPPTVHDRAVTPRRRPSSGGRARVAATRGGEPVSTSGASLRYTSPTPHITSVTSCVSLTCAVHSLPSGEPVDVPPAARPRPRGWTGTAKARAPSWTSSSPTSRPSSSISPSCRTLGSSSPCGSAVRCATAYSAPSSARRRGTSTASVPSGTVALRRSSRSPRACSPTPGRHDNRSAPLRVSEV